MLGQVRTLLLLLVEGVDHVERLSSKLAPPQWPVDDSR
jgi:hypothetical protein